jgi:hypothetical protein
VGTCIKDFPYTIRAVCFLLAWEFQREDWLKSANQKKEFSMPAMLYTISKHYHIIIRPSSIDGF